jgi:hypothetical protein
VTIAARSVGVLLLSGLLLAPGLSFAQDSKSAPLAAELCKLLDEKKLDSIAARQVGDQYIGALYFSGVQLLVVDDEIDARESRRGLSGM